MTAIAILQDHRRHFINRLISRSPLLKCTPNSYREDLTELIKNEKLTELLAMSLEPDERTRKTSAFDVLQNLLAPVPEKVEIFNAQIKNLAKCTKIKNETNDYFHTTGQRSFYLGYPFIAIRLGTNKYYLAPLFLWAVSCRVTASSIIFDRERNDERIALEPQLNRILQVWLAKEKNIHLQWKNTNTLNWNNISTETKSILSDWIECDSNLDNTQVDTIPDNEFLQNLINAKVVPSAIIGYMPIKGQALLDDLDKLEVLFRTNSNNSHVLNYFLTPRELKTEQSANNPIENDKWLVTESDHSQESVLWNTRKFDLMVLQGPPGTGKSQVIVNLIADAIAKQKTVLVVCEKRAALEVLKKRLVATELGELVQLIDDAQKDRTRIVKSILNIANNSLTGTQIDEQRQKTSNSLKNCEEFLDKSNRFLTNYEDNPNERQKQRLTYGNLKARLNILNQQNIYVEGELQTLYQNCLQNKLLPNNLQELENIKADTLLFIENYQQCDYKNNLWIYLENKPNSISQVNNVLKHLVKLAQDLKSKNNQFYPSNLKWIIEHSLIQPHYLSFLSSEHQQTHTNLKELLIRTQSLKNWLSAPYVDIILAAIHTDEVIKHYQQLLDFSGSIAQVSFVKDKLKQREVFNLVLKNKTYPVSSLTDIVECFTLQAWFDELLSKGSISEFNFDQEKKELEKLIKQKRIEDIEDILKKYSSRMDARNKLQNKSLLSNGRNTSLRKLYTSGFKELHEIYPVLLTNPETASSILDLKDNLYDLVVIDEASQMFMADALPLLYRAKTVFISGDTKQMPPSDFFMALGNDTDNDGNLEGEDDDEPIVVRDSFIPADKEYCLLEAAEYSIQKGNPNQATLSVHYRSEFKELIDFSNHAFYEGKLIASTSNKELPNIIKSPIELCEISDSDYSTGVNKKEALEVVKKIEEIWRQANSLSLGVITLNVAQKKIIDDLIFEKTITDNEFSNLFEQARNKTKDGEDIGFFVRSVEHVQGDERDIIILSTVYDGERKNFGAITKKEKGRKRLNVAITRAKLGIIVYTSLIIDSISDDNQRNVSENYWFWKYMCYARAISLGNKEAAELVLQSLNSELPQSKAGAEPDSYFEIDVAEFLRNNGFHVDYQIGESGFRIDLGVKHNKDDRLYLCGIECDGRQYHSSWTARLNDIWRQKILENKGWRIVRIWSNDWFDNREATQKKLLADLNRV
jgi:very-short-patch-repair endonuclease